MNAWFEKYRPYMNQAGQPGGDPPDEIRYDLHKASPLTSTKFLCAAIAAGVLWIVSLLLRQAPLVAYIFPVLCLAGLLVAIFRRQEIVVDRDQVKAPLRKAVSWSDVDYVEDASRWGSTVTLHLKDGSSWRTGLPPGYAGDVARIGQVPLGGRS